MAANVETMFSVRKVPWHGLGTLVEEARTSEEALRLAGLDWTVTSKPVYDGEQNEIPGYKMNIRESDNRVLGIVRSRYQIVQNAEAFAFTDAMLGEGVTYETAGSLQGGRRIWLLARMPKTTILGDAVEPYMCFTNAHDGTSAIRVCMTPVRVVCCNTLNLALSTANRSWSAVHSGNVMTKVSEAKWSLGLAEKYMVSLDEEADRLANAKMSEGEIRQTLDALIPVPEDGTDRQKNTATAAQEEIMVCMLRPDLAAYLNTKWGFVNAVADFVGHSKPKRETKNFEENRWSNIIVGHRLLDKAMNLVR